MGIQLYGVVLQNADSCLTYALKRIGVYERVYSSSILIDIDTVKQLKCFNFFPYKEEFLQLGDILIWNHRVRRKYRPLEILENGRIIWRTRMEGYHVAVFENEGILSDVRLTDSSYLEINLHRLIDVTTPPAYILRYVP